MNNKVIKIPCIGICEHNEQNFCIGCKRNSDEIINWNNYSHAIRDAIMEDLKDRNIET